VQVSLLLAALWLAPASPEPVRAFVGAEILPIAGPPIARGVLVVRDGRIAEVGPEGATPIPPGAEVVRLDGKTIMPGLVDTHSHIGGWGGGDGSHPIQPDARIVDALNPRDTGFRRALAGGITTINIMPGSGHLMSGQTIYVKNRPGSRLVDDLLIRAADGWTMGGMKMANGTNPIRTTPPWPGNRSKSMAMVREHFVRAKEYKERRDRFRERLGKGEAKPEDAPAVDLGMEAMAEVLEGRRIVHHHTHRADDIVSVLRLQREFGFRVVLQHVSEAWKVADEIAAANAPCSIIVLDAPGGKQEAIDIQFRSGGDLERRGVLVAYHTDDGITDSRLFMRSAALGVRGGMTRKGALEALTIAGAKMMDLGDRVGSLERGKDADFLILSGDPLSVYTKIEQVWVEGRKAFDLADPRDRLYAVGGYGAGYDREPYLCCGGHE
jgi:imidazolonepropionase-like amidohydrolase